MFVGGDQEAPRSEVGAIDHHVFWWDCDGGKAASLWVVEFLVTMQESVTASLGRLKTGEHHPLDAGVEEFHRVLAEVATIR